MPRRSLVSLSIVGLLLAACGGGSGGAASSAPPATGGPSGSATRIEVKLTDALKMEPATFTVPAGVPVTFVVTNVGSTDHEFYLGDEAAQAKHEEEMKVGGMMHDDPDGISLKGGETKELTHTFAQPGETLAGCHVAGHYVVGMKATITVAG
ncbi:MAG TPA: plastocyanin/azurin family copper-binding protein [Candidatus Eisenbacteria bacterium]|nr:plastocyanin/azurin family copper-binding protein [Candidatus Eisenbacteria bacterium]